MILGKKRHVKIDFSAPKGKQFQCEIPKLSEIELDQGSVSVLFICKFYKYLLNIADPFPSQGQNVFFLHSRGSNSKQTFEIGRKSNLSKILCLS